MPNPQPHQHTHEQDTHRHDHGDAVLAELLDLDGEVLRSYWSDVLGRVRAAATGTGRILDLGAGSGVGTIKLAELFDTAEVIAVDSSADMLHRLRDKASDLDLAGRIRTVHADLDDGWPAVGTVDVTWASMSLHHLSEPDRVLGDVFAATAPGGLVAVAEMDEPVRMLPDELGTGRAGLERRCLDAVAAERAHALPDLGSDWSPRLERAGFVVLEERTMAVSADDQHSPATVRYAELWLGRLRTGVAEHLAQDDLATLDLLLGDGPESLRHRGDLHVRGSRSVTLARRP